MKRLLKILAWVVGILVVLIIVAVVAAKLFFPVEKVKALAVERGSAMLGRDISVEGLDISFWGGLGVELQQVQIGNPPSVEGSPFMTARNIDLKLQLLPLITGEVRVDRLVIEDPHIYMHKTPEGLTNYAFEPADSVVPPEAAEVKEKLAPEAQAAAAAISFDKLEIENGLIVYRDDSTGLTFETVNLDLATSLENPRDGFYASAGEVAIDSVKITMDETYPVFSLGLDYQIGYDLNERRVVLERADVELDELDFRITGEVIDPVGEMSATVNIKSERLTVADLLQLLPPDRLKSAGDIDVAGDFTLDADVEYNAADTTAPLLYTGTALLTDLKASRKDIDGELAIGRCVLDFKPDNLRFNIEDGSFDGQPFKGHLLAEDFSDPKVSGEMAGSFDLAFVQPFLPSDPVHHVAGETCFDIKFSGRVSRPEDMTFSGNLSVQNGSYRSELIPEPIDSFDVDLYFDNDLVHIRQLSCRFPSGTVGFSGRVNDLAAYMLADSAVSPRVEGKLLGQLNLSMLNPFLPDKGHPRLSGHLAADLTFAGALTDPTSFRPHGNMSITEGTYMDSLLPEPVEEFEALIELDPDTLTLSSTRVKFASSDVAFSGQLANPLPYLLPVEGLDRSGMKRPFFNFYLSSHRFDIDKLFPEAVPGSAEAPTAVSADSVSLLILPDIDGRGTLRADTVIYCSVEFTALNGKVRVRDRKIECYDVTAEVYTGNVSGNTTVDLNDFEDPHYSGEFAGQQIEANDFISRFSGFGGHLYGKANLTGSYSANGWEPDTFLNSLSMNGHADMREGKLVTSGTVYTLLNGLAEKTGQSFAKEQPIKALSTDIAVADGRVKLDKLQSSLGNLGKMAVDGYYGFDGSLDYTGELELSRSASEKLLSGGGLLSNVSSLFGTKETQQLVLPLKVTGTVDNPKTEIDYSALSKNLNENLKNEAGGLLDKLLKK